MVSVAAGNESLAFESLDTGGFRVRLAAHKPAEISYTWTIALNDLKFVKGHYRAQLQATMPVQSYKLKVAIDPDGPWVQFKDVTQSAWTSFSSGKQDTLTRFFGSCSLAIRAKE